MALTILSLSLILLTYLSASESIRIINGNDAVPGSQPHQIGLQWSFLGLWYFMCGGSVIGKNVVLTAAHCVTFGPASEFRVVVNDHSRYEDDGTEQYIAVSRIIMHHDYIPTQDYDKRIFPNDIAILLLEEEVADESNIIPLASHDFGNFDNVLCTISGWGRNDTFEPTTDILQVVNMTVLSQEECGTFWELYNIYPGQICIYGGEDPVEGAAACNGDSGGPMVCDGVLAGVTSWGLTGCRDQETGSFVPSVYARVSYYYSWIQMVLGMFQLGRG